jgi:GntR family transcriptional regulator/MocR family aminotransferase
VVVTPSHQYPLGMAMSLGRRLALLTWAEDHDAAIVEDDYDSEFKLSGRPVEPLQMLDEAGRVIYVGTFSRTMLPTLRLGFAVVPDSIRRAMEAAKFVTDWHSPIATQLPVDNQPRAGLLLGYGGIATQHIEEGSRDCAPPSRVAIPASVA